MSNCTNMAFSFVGFAEWTCENHCSTSCVLLHWLTPLASLHVWFTLSSILLLTLPKLFEAGLITRHLILLGNSCLWSLMVMNAFDLLWHSILSSISKARAYFWVSLLMSASLYIYIYIPIYSRVTYIYVRSRAKYLKFRTTTSKINTLRKPLMQQKYYFIHEM